MPIVGGKNAKKYNQGDTIGETTVEACSENWFGGRFCKDETYTYRLWVLSNGMLIVTQTSSLDGIARIIPKEGLTGATLTPDFQGSAYVDLIARSTDVASKLKLNQGDPVDPSYLTGSGTIELPDTSQPAKPNQVAPPGTFGNLPTKPPGGETDTGLSTNTLIGIGIGGVLLVLVAVLLSRR